MVLAEDRVDGARDNWGHGAGIRHEPVSFARDPPEARARPGEDRTKRSACVTSTSADRRASRPSSGGRGGRPKGKPGACGLSARNLEEGGRW